MIPAYAIPAELEQLHRLHRSHSKSQKKLIHIRLWLIACIILTNCSCSQKLLLASKICFCFCLAFSLLTFGLSEGTEVRITLGTATGLGFRPLSVKMRENA